MSSVEAIQRTLQAPLTSEQKWNYLAPLLDQVTVEIARQSNFPHEQYESLLHQYMHIAVHLNLLDLARFLLAECRLSPNIIRNFRQVTGLESAGTPLSDAAAEGLLPMIDLLVQHGANLEMTDARDWTPLHEAIANNQLAAIQRLLYYGANALGKLGAECNILHLLRAKETAEFILDYLDRNNQLDILINQPDYFGTTPLADALFSKREDVALIFLNKYLHKINVNRAEAHGNTLLHYAVYFGLESIVLRLLALGAKNIPNKDGETPLMWAEDKYGTQSSLYLALKQRTTGVVYEAPSSTKPNCARQYLRTKQVIEQTNMQTEASHHHTHTQLVHRNKQNTIKFQFSLDKEQHDLRATLNQLPPAEGNSIIVNLAFEILITSPDGTQQLRDVIKFPLKIPFRWTSDSPNVSFSYVNDNYGKYTLDKLYNAGLTILGGQSHGHKPDYSGQTPKHDQYINHTEQLLAAYLCRPDGIAMIVNRLIAEIRSKHPQFALGSIIKIYNMIINLHSEKTPCAPCEYVMVGLQNSQHFTDSYFLGFSRLFEQELEIRTRNHLTNQPNSPFQFNYPKRNKYNPANETIKVLTLYTADNVDGDHKIPIIPTQALPGDDRPTEIPTKWAGINPYIFLAHYGRRLEYSMLNPAESDMSQRSVLVSGSAGTQQNRGKVMHTNQAIDSELNHALDGVSLLLR